MMAARTLLAVVLVVTTSYAAAQSSLARQDHAQLREVVAAFLKVQAGGLPGEITINVGAIDPRLNLAACTAPEAFLPNGSRAWGKTSVGVRCTVPSPWTVYIPAVVHVTGEYLVAAVPVAQGQTIGANDLAKLRGDLTALPPGIVTKPEQAVGFAATRSFAVGAPLRQDALRAQQAVAMGQAVRVVVSGPGFKVASEGRALANGADGATVQVRTPAGQVVSGLARMGGIVEVSY